MSANRARKSRPNTSPALALDSLLTVIDNAISRAAAPPSAIKTQPGMLGAPGGITEVASLVSLAALVAVKWIDRLTLTSAEPSGSMATSTW